MLIPPQDLGLSQTIPAQMAGTLACQSLLVIQKPNALKNRPTFNVIQKPAVMTHEPDLTQQASSASLERLSKSHVVLLNNYITPHHLPVYEALQKRVGKLTVLLSTPMEPNRTWKPNWGSLDVRIQKNITLTRRLKHSYGFQDNNFIHIPYDTLGQLKTINADVIVSYEMGFRTLLSQYNSWRRKIPLVMVCNISQHTENQVIFSRRILRSIVKRFASTVTYNGPSCRQYLEETLQIDPKRLYHVPYASDPAKHYRGPTTRTPAFAHRLLYTSHLNDRKGITPFLEALSRWCDDNPHRNVEFNVAGTGPLRDKLESASRPSNLSVTFHGDCDSEKLANLYRDSGLFVFTTFADEWGMVAEEAWMAGLPVLGSKFAQSFEALVQEGENGWMFQPTSIDQMYNKIDQAMNTTYARLEEMRIRCRETVINRTPESAAQKFAHAIAAAFEV